MNKKSIFRMIVDMLMTITIIVLMAYSLVGETLHEVMGIAMFVLFIVHHVLNRAWTKNIFKGKYSSYRVWQTILVVLIFVCMLCQMFSGIMLSKHIFKIISIPVSGMLVRNMHMLGAYWGFVLMSLHLGLHLNAMIISMRHGKKMETRTKWIFRGIGIGVLVYGLYAFVKREILKYMFMMSMFVYFDFNEPRAFFFFDYVMVMGAFAVIGHYVGRFLKTDGEKAKE